MPSSLSWLDYSEYERRKMLDVIDLFRERETRDELGIGAIRDTFANTFFPGTSTIQTRARYFFFIPWMYLELERKMVPTERMASRARAFEISLVDSLMMSEDTDGVIGKVARKSLQRLPSNIYWQGLGILGIRRFPGSQDQYYKSLNSFYARKKAQLKNDDMEFIDGSPLSNWSYSIPDLPKDFPTEANLLLLQDEAKCLIDRIRTSAPASLFAILVGQVEHIQYVEFPWYHPDFGNFPAEIKRQLIHARNFSEAFLGAVLLYNLILAELSGMKDREEEYQQRLKEWSLYILERITVFKNWDIQYFWAMINQAGTRIGLKTKGFVEGWMSILLENDLRSEIATDRLARELIQSREKSLKGKLSRIDNARARDLWRGASGTGQLNYRWPIALRILNDIEDGLRN